MRVAMLDGDDLLPAHEVGGMRAAVLRDDESSFPVRREDATGFPESREVAVLCVRPLEPASRSSSVRLVD
jgi:hypothetical protein